MGRFGITSENYFLLWRPFLSCVIMLAFLYQKGCTVSNYHEPCLHPRFESSGLLNRQIKPARSGRWNEVSDWISDFIRGKIETGCKHQEEMNLWEGDESLYAQPPNMTEFAGRSVESNSQPCCKALHLQCSAVQLQLGGGGKSLFSLTLAQSFAAFKKNQPLCLPLMSPS